MGGIRLIQSISDLPHLQNRTRAADEALDTILDKIERGESISTRQADFLLANRAKKQRHRQILLAREADLFRETAANENDRLEARSTLAWYRGRCGNREWRVLWSIGMGYAYSNIADAEQVPEATIKTWVRRSRLKLVA